MQSSRRIPRGFLPLLTGLALGAAVVACEPAVPRSQFGEYRPPFKQLRLPGGDTLTVYRVKLWTFTDGGASALQLEYEAPFAVAADTVAAHRMARRVWPAFAPYLSALHLEAAILTATNLRRHGGPGAWTSTSDSFGITARRDSVTGDWHLSGDPTPVPAATDGRDAKAGVYERDGSPLVVAPTA